MTKHRTRKQKEAPNYSFLIPWKPDSKRASGSLVKGQFKNEAKKVSSEADRRESANLLDKNAPFGHIKRDLVKSLILASFIIALELVVYLAWYVK